MEVGTAADPVEVQAAAGDERIAIGEENVPRRADAVDAVVEEVGRPAAGHLGGFLVVVLVRGVDAGQGRGQFADRREIHAVDAELAGMRVEVEAAVGALVEFQELRLVGRIGDGRAGFAVLTGGGIDDHEVRADEFDDTGERTVVTGEGVDVFVGFVLAAVTGEPAGGGIEFAEMRAGIGTDPDGTVVGLGEAQAEGAGFVHEAEILDAALGMIGVKAVQMPVPRRAEVEHAGAQGAVGGGGKG